MPLAIWLTIRNALVLQSQYFAQRKAKAMPKYIGGWEQQIRRADAALRWLDTQQPNDILPPQLAPAEPVVESTAPKATQLGLSTLACLLFVAALIGGAR